MNPDEHDSRRDEFDRDDELRVLLHAGDPAASLTAADPDALSHLLASTISTPDAAVPVPVAVPAAESGDRRRPGTWLVGAAAAAVVVIAGVGAVHNQLSSDSTTVSQRGSAAAPTSAPIDPTPAPPSSTGSSTGPVTSTLTVSDASFEARCAVPNATSLQVADTAFAGTVTSIHGNRVILQRADTYRGNVADTVTVRAPAADLSRLVQSVRFRVGGNFLVSAAGGQVALCGFTGPAKASLKGIYTEAFPR